MWSHLLCCWKRVFSMTSAFSWQNSVNFHPASFCSPKPNLPVTPVIFWLPSVTFQSPVVTGTSFLFLVLVLGGLLGLHRTYQPQLLWHWWWGHRLGLLWYWMFCPRNKPRSFCNFWGCTQVLYFGLFCWLLGLLHFCYEIHAHSSKHNAYMN